MATQRTLKAALESHLSLRGSIPSTREPITTVTTQQATPRI
ncbi:hypothetical protein [Xanthomonas sp. MUS 060]|nr:hypothetical protein [Xanthomonas sp. MUS 060]